MLMFILGFWVGVVAGAMWFWSTLSLTQPEEKDDGD